MRRLVIGTAGNIAALWAAARIVGNVDLSRSWWTVILAALVLTLLNWFIKPAIKLLALPLVLITLGVALFFISMLMLWLTSVLVSGFEIHGFWPLVKATIIVWLVQMIVQAIFDPDRDADAPRARARVEPRDRDVLTGRTRSTRAANTRACASTRQPPRTCARSRARTARPRRSRTPRPTSRRSRGRRSRTTIPEVSGDRARARRGVGLRDARPRAAGELDRDRDLVALGVPALVREPGAPARLADAAGAAPLGAVERRRRLLLPRRRPARAAPARRARRLGRGGRRHARTHAPPARRAEDFLLCALMGLAGLRVSEVCALDMGDIDERHVLVRAGKGNRRRSVPTDPAIWAALEQHRPAGLHLFGMPTAPARRITRNALEVRISRLARYAGLGRVTPHVLRHSFATAVGRDPQAVVVLRDLLGHRSVNTTSRYLHSRDDERRAVLAEARARRLGRTSPVSPVRPSRASRDGRRRPGDRADAARLQHRVRRRDAGPGGARRAHPRAAGAPQLRRPARRHRPGRPRRAALPPLHLVEQPRVLHRRAVRPALAPPVRGSGAR